MYKINDLIEIANVVAEWEPQLAEFVYRFVAQDVTGHDIYHCLRVKRLAIHIANCEDLDHDILVATAYLHDTGRGRELLGGGDHVEYGTLKAREILPDINFPPHKIDAVIHAIKYHEEYEWAKTQKEINHTAIREILGFQDADRIDAIGAIGIARMFSFGGAYQQPLWIPEGKPGPWQHGQLSTSTYNHLYEKLFKLKDTMNTATGRKIAENRYRFMQQFAKQFEGEWSGAI